MLELLVLQQVVNVVTSELQIINDKQSQYMTTLTYDIPFTS